MQLQKFWYAVYTKPFWEKKISELLDKMIIENYCPLQKVVRQWSDRKKTILEPLFKSYVFVRIPDQGQSIVRQVNGIINFVNFMGRPAVIRDLEIATIKQFLNDFNNIKVQKLDFHVNDRVKVVGGPFMNMDGNITEIRNKTVKVSLPSFGYVLTAEFSKANLERSVTPC